MDPPYINPNAANVKNYGLQQQAGDGSGLRSRTGQHHQPPSQHQQQSGSGMQPNNFDDFFQSMTSAAAPAANAPRATTTVSTAYVPNSYYSSAPSAHGGAGGGSAINIDFGMPRHQHAMQPATTTADKQQLQNYLLHSAATSHATTGPVGGYPSAAAVPNSTGDSMYGSGAAGSMSAYNSSNQQYAAQFPATNQQQQQQQSYATSAGSSSNFVYAVPPQQQQQQGSTFAAVNNNNNRNAMPGGGGSDYQFNAATTAAGGLNYSNMPHKQPPLPTSTANQMSSYFNNNNKPPSTSATNNASFFTSAAAAGGLTADFLAQPAAGMAMAYGQTFLSQGTDIVSKKIENIAELTGLNKIKFYFAVDNAYVARKLGILLFPFARRDWSLKYRQQQQQQSQQSQSSVNDDAGQQSTGMQQQPIPPRYDVNCPDLYIPVMALATYLLIGGWSLGLANRFNPEQLSSQLSRALTCLALEVIAIFLIMYLTNLKSRLSLVHVVIYSGYKYVAMSIVLLASMFLGSTGYWIAVCYTGLSVAFFCIRSLRVYMLEEVTLAGHAGMEQNMATKRRLWILLGISLFQPLMIYWLTRDVAYSGVLQSMMTAFLGGGGGAAAAVVKNAVKGAKGSSGMSFLDGNVVQKSLQA